MNKHMKVKVSDSLDNVPNENVFTHLVSDQLSDQLLELLKWLFATKNFPWLITGTHRAINNWGREDKNSTCSSR